MGESHGPQRTVGTAGGQRPVRVLHVITGLQLGGAERMLVALATARHPALEHRVVSLLGGGAFAEPLRAAGVPLLELGMSRRWPGPGGPARLAAAIRRLRPDIVQGWLYHGDLAALAGLALSGLRRRTALLWGLQCSDLALARYHVRLRLAARTWIALSFHPDAILSNSVAGAAVHRARGGRPRRCEIVPPGIDVARFRPDPAARAEVRAELGVAPEAPLLVQAARFDPMKDHATALAALARLPGAWLVAAGTGTERLPAAPRLIRLGERRDMERILAAGDLGISSSAFGEGFCNALAEGMAAGLPAVATAVGDARLMIGETGRVVPVGDAAALAAAAAALLDEPAEVRRARATAARARIVERFALGAMVDRFAELYGALARSTSAAARVTAASPALGLEAGGEW
jgi:glycosyltransferase involved in cell wall biosynthesis